jgi:hypothetical protein
MHPVIISIAGDLYSRETWAEGKGAECRISTSLGIKLPKRANGYIAHTPPHDPSGEGVYDSHDHMHYGEGSNTHAPAAYSGNIDARACKDKCMQMQCTCCDYSAGGPAEAAPLAVLPRRSSPDSTATQAPSTALVASLTTASFQGSRPAS